MGLCDDTAGLSTLYQIGREKNNITNKLKRRYFILSKKKDQIFCVFWCDFFYNRKNGKNLYHGITFRFGLIHDCPLDSRKNIYLS